MRVKAISLSSPAEPTPASNNSADLRCHASGSTWKGELPGRRSFSRSPFPSKWLFLLPDNHLIRRLNEITDYIRKVLSLPPIRAAPEVTALTAPLSSSSPSSSFLSTLICAFFLLSSFPPPLLFLSLLFKTWALDFKICRLRSAGYVNVCKLFNYVRLTVFWWSTGARRQILHSQFSGMHCSISLTPSDLMFPLLYRLSVIYGHHQRKYFPSVAHAELN